MERLRGRVCVVAGVCGTLGEAVAKRFAAEGGIVVGVDKVDHELGVQSLRADLSDEGQVFAAYQTVYDRFGRLDVIYNNAGLIDPEDHSALELSHELWSRVLAANLTTTWLTASMAFH